MVDVVITPGESIPVVVVQDANGNPVVVRHTEEELLQLLVGPPGPQGPPGRTVNRFWGDGPPPDYILGAQPQDEYIDRLTGTLYILT